MPALCHRCQRDLPSLAGERGAPQGRDDILLFCPHCAAPQIRLPEYSQTPHPLAASTGAMPPPRPDGLPGTQHGAFSQAQPHVNWRAALRACALVAAAAAVANLLQMAGDNAVGIGGSYLLQLLTLGGAVLAVALYAQMSPRTHLTLRRGLSIGIVTGLLMTAAIGLTVAGAGVVARFTLHSEAFNTTVETTFAAARKSTVDFLAAQPNGPEAARQWNATMEMPERRAGVALSGFAFLAIYLTLISALGGAAAGLLRTPRRRLPS